MKFALSLKTLCTIWLVGIGIAAYTVTAIYNHETQQFRSQLETRLSNKIHALNQSLQSTKLLLESTRAFLIHSNQPTQHQFEQFLENRTGMNANVQSILWAPAIKKDSLEILKEDAKQQGFLGYDVYPLFTETDESALFSQMTLPVFYLSSRFEASNYLGWRLESRPTSRQAVEDALASGQAKIILCEEDNQIVARVFLPIVTNDKQLDGVVVANIIVHEFFGFIWQDLLNSTHTLIQVDSLDSEQMLFRSHFNTDLNTHSFYEQVASVSRDISVPLVDRKWRVSITVLNTSGSIWLYSAGAVGMILLLTLSVTLATNFYATRLFVSNRIIEEKTKSLARQAVTDGLTKMYNRSALTHEINLMLEQLRAGASTGFSILFIDLDRFKVINDSLGHLLGDQILIEVAKRIQGNCRRGDMGFRFGGDEFIIYLPELTDPQELSRICQRYSKLLSEPYTINQQDFHIAASIGISIVTDPKQDLTTILREADTAMYQAKSASHEKVVFFHDEMFKKAQMRFQLEQDLAVAMELRQLNLVYQPIYDTSSEQVTGFEALLRWNHPNHGFIPPDVFIPIAEETGLIIKIGDWVAKETCKTIDRHWNSGANGPLRFNINVSAKQFESNHIYHSLKGILANYDFPPECLGVEITESLMLSRSKCSKEKLLQLKQLGIVLYLDDFGTGYSSLSVLKDYPVDIVKVDRSFVNGLAQGDATGDNLCLAIINMAHTIKMKVVAEGVETSEQLALLSSFDCNYIQGYLKSKPITGCKLETFLSPQTRKTA